MISNIISADLVKTLREKTSVSMMECKKALQETNGDIEAAVDLLRKSGMLAAVKKQSRVAKEGFIVTATSTDNQIVAILEINCETDFVAKNDKLSDFAKEVVKIILTNKIADLNQLNQQPMSTNTVEQNRLTLVAQLGENIVLRKAELISLTKEHQILGVYMHGVPAKIASIICLEGGDLNLARDIAMHVAAMRPEYVSQADINKERYEKEEKIFMEQTKLNNGDKPEEIIKKIAAGRVSKFFKELTLLDQIYVKDPDLTIGKLLAKYNAKIIKMLRIEVGEGIEKKEQNFKDEVMQMQQVNSKK